VVGCSTAVQNARHRFALAAAAPALENVGIIAVLGILAVLHPQVPPLQDVPTSVLVILGVGATGAVALHAAVQWWGARRAGVTLRPRAGWRDPEVLALVRRALPALGLAGLAAVQLLTVLVLANRVPGGVVAVQLGLTFYFFVVAIAATPIGLSVLPRLSRLHAAGDPAAFRATWTRGVALALFLTVPAAVGYVVLARPLARVVAVGHMGTADGIALVAVTLMAFAPGVVGEGLFQVLTYVFYARHDSRTPMWSMGVQVGSFLVLACGALLVEGGAVPLVLGLAFSTANTIGVCHLGVRLLRGDTGPLGQLGPTVWRTLTATAVMAVPAWGLSVLIPRLVGGAAGRWLSVGTAVAAGVVLYVGLQAWWRAPELAEVLGSRGAGPGPARPVTRRLSPARRAARRAAR
jgi:putative peptidoglycan lipid II flippase